MSPSLNRFRTLIAVLLAGSALLTAGPDAALAARYADDLFGSQKLRKKSGASMQVPLYDGKRFVGEVHVRTSAQGTLQIGRVTVLELLGDILPDTTVASLQVRRGDRLTLEELASLGVPLRYDEAGLALFTDFSADDRRSETITLSGRRRAPLAATPPAGVSAIFNMSLETAHFWERDETAVRFSGEQVLNIEQFVIENEFDVDNAVQTNGCSTQILCASDYYSGVKRRGTRLVRDFPDERLRLTVGDIRSPASLIGRSNDIAGVYLEHSHRKLAPDERVTGAGSSSFRLERPSRVEVSINGAMMQALDLPAGNYNLNDLPLQTGANHITLKIVDNQGIARTIELDRFAGDELLAEGKSEWTLAAGVPSYFDAGSLEYQQNDIFASVFGRYGVFSDLTLEGEAQTDGVTVLASVGALTSTPWGIWGIAGSLSAFDGDVAPAVRATWKFYFHRSESIYASAEVHASNFRLPGNSYEPITNTFIPPYAHKSSLSAGYGRELPWDFFMNVSGRYDVADPKYVEAVPFAPKGDLYALDLSISHCIFDTGSLTATIGYSNQTLGSRWLDESLDGYSDSPDGELWAGLRLSWRPSEKTTLSASTETLNSRSYVQGSYTTQQGTDSWSTSVTAYDDESGATSLAPTIAYRGQRAEVQVTHDTGFESFLFASTDSLQPENRTYARVDTALVFADGHLGISAPLRGNGGFAILYPHESVADMDITVGDRERPIAQSDGLGAIVVRDLASHSDATIPYDMPDLPLDMSLGTGNYGVHPWYRSGYALEVGSGKTVTLIGRLLNRDGEPLDLASGMASDGKRSVPVFTSRSGKFAADSLSPGRWVLSMADESGDLDYAVEIPGDASGNMRIGDLRP